MDMYAKLKLLLCRQLPAKEAFLPGPFYMKRQILDLTLTSSTERQSNSMLSYDYSKPRFLAVNHTETE